MVTDEERIELIEARRAKANAKAKAQVLRLRGRIRKRRQREDTRRKVLAGAMLLDATERGKVSAEETLTNMDDFLKRATDRALFGLPAKRGADSVAQAAQAVRSGLWRGVRHSEDTRRKILAGAMLLDKVKRGVFPEVLVKAMMDVFLQRETDRALFDLPPQPDDDQAG